MHNIYRYHAKFNPIIPKYFIEEYCSKDFHIIDPFCGSGTTLLECLYNQIDVVGLDISPIAILNSKVKTNSYKNSKIETYYKNIVNKSNNNRVLIPDFPDRNIWFDEKMLNELGRIYFNINEIEEEKYRDLFILMFLGILNKTSRRRKTWNLGYIADNVMPNLDSKADPLKEFEKKYKYVIKNNKENIDIKSKVECYNINAKDYKDNRKYDAVITSPPYPFAVDFIKYHRLQLYWLEKPVDELFKEEIGARNKRGRNIEVDNFFDDMELTYKNIMDIIKPGGYWCMTIGNTKRKKEKINFIDWSIRIFEKNGWKLIENKTRELKNQTTGQKRIPFENIVVLQKNY